MASPTTGREYLPEAGYYAPDFTLTTIDDEAITLSDLQGHPVMILFWATWCGYCRDEMPTIQQISDDYADEGLIVIGINGSDSANDVRNYRSSLNLTFPLLMDSNQIVSALYRVDGYPSLYYIDRAGLIQVVQGGSGGPSMLYANLDQILP
jgi:thiol-disulfide isomerase/thioredoxin